MALITSSSNGNTTNIRVKGATEFTRKDGSKDKSFRASASGFHFGSYGSVSLKLSVADLRELADAAEAADCDVVDFAVSANRRNTTAAAPAAAEPAV